MKILFLTSSTSNKVFNSLCENANFKPNPSNQIFYNKLIKALNYYNEVSVISHRPFTNGMYHASTLSEFDDKEDNINYYYTRIKGDYFYKIFLEQKNIYKRAVTAIDNFKDDNIVIIVDPLRRSLLKAALKLKKRYHFPIIGMLTDNPYNLTKSTKKYSSFVIKNTANLDGFLSITNGLVEAYKVKNKPHYIFEGLVEEINEYKKEPLGDYFAFAGSVNERYGIKNLIDAFEFVDQKYNLVILGNGTLEKYINNKIKTNPRILFLSQISKEKVYAIEQHAIANINPRPHNTILDYESIPSKMFEYLASGVPTISTMHPRLHDLFTNEVFWIDNDSPEGIAKTINEFLQTSKIQINKKVTTAKVKVYEMFGLHPQGEGISHFLDSLKISSK